MLLLASATTFAASSNVTSAVDGGGQRTTSAAYTMDGSVAGIGGIPAAANYTGKNGYIGQLTEVASVSVTGTPATVNEGATSQLTGTATMDDASATALSGAEVSWNAPIYPIASINGSGLATASLIFSNATGTVSGQYLGVLGTGNLQVLDSIPDNFGTYAGDGLPDSWQNQFFGLNNPNAAPAVDPDGDGQNNEFEYMADVVPTNSTSLFVLRVANVTGQPTQKNLIFNPLAVGRTYIVESRTNLNSGSFAALPSFSGPATNVNQVTVTDLDATQPGKFYRVKISLP